MDFIKYNIKNSKILYIFLVLLMIFNSFSIGEGEGTFKIISFVVLGIFIVNLIEDYKNYKDIPK